MSCSLVEFLLKNGFHQNPDLPEILDNNRLVIHTDSLKIGTTTNVRGNEDITDEMQELGFLCSRAEKGFVVPFHGECKAYGVLKVFEHPVFGKLIYTD